MGARSFPHHDNYSEGTPAVPIALKILGFFFNGMQQLTDVPVHKVSKTSSKS